VQFSFNATLDDTAFYMIKEKKHCYFLTLKSSINIEKIPNFLAKCLEDQNNEPCANKTFYNQKLFVMKVLKGVSLKKN